jgi:hypothetical protein
MKKRREPEGAPEERKRQFEDQRGLSDSPELPLDPDKELEEAEKPESDPAEDKKKKEDDTEGGFE